MNHSNKKLLLSSKRHLNLQEYQSKQIMHDRDIKIQPFRLVNEASEVSDIMKTFPQKEYVIKAQILAGGRGKGTFSNGYKGGVQLTRNADEVHGIVKQMLGHHLTTKQTTADGVLVTKVMIAEALDIERETYLAILMDRDHGGPVIVSSPCGGMDIETVAEEQPDAIHKEYIDIMQGLQKEQLHNIVSHLKFEKGSEQYNVASEQINKLYKLFCELDCVQVEINPFVETPCGRVLCFDAKFAFDDNAAFRHVELFASEDKSELDAREVEAQNANLNYVGLNGNIGCLVNGAGLAMATMDMIKLYGGEPANFLDVGGAVKEAQVKQAFELISSDERVKCIFVNIFGGIVDCETIAKGIVGACRSMTLEVPLVVRLEGTNVTNAKKYIADSGIPIIAAASFAEAAEKAVACLSK